MSDASKEIELAKYSHIEYKLNGIGTKIDKKNAALMMFEFADQGYTEAEYDYAMMILNEIGIKKDEKIAILEKRPTLEEIQEGRAGSIVLAVDPNGDNITLGVTIEQSDNLVEWTKLNGEMTRTIPIPDGKKFYRFALDK